MTEYSFLPVLLKFGVEDTLYKIAYIRNVPSVINLHDLFQIVTYFSLDYTGESHDMFIGTQGRKSFNYLLRGSPTHRQVLAQLLLTLEQHGRWGC